MNILDNFINLFSIESVRDNTFIIPIIKILFSKEYFWKDILNIYYLKFPRLSFIIYIFYNINVFRLNDIYISQIKKEANNQLF